MYLANNEVA